MTDDPPRIVVDGRGPPGDGAVCVECGKRPVRARGLAHCAPCATARRAAPMFDNLSAEELAALRKGTE